MQKKWWKESVVYQIYPRSFMDSNKDGIGDLRGIISKLDYLANLGVDVVWLSPVYKSPNHDNGYDISDYQGIMTELGTMQDWEDLRDGLHERGIKLVMDLVVNHTSDEHPWFIESRSVKKGPYRDYYIWRSGKDGREPNNWLSEFGGSAWEYDPSSDEYYLHIFSKHQPDLNWENKELREEIYEMMQWWLDRGVDGFRMDVINMISKAPGLPDAPPGGGGSYHWGGAFFINGPRLQYFLREMNLKVLSKYDIMTVGETRGVNPELAEVFVCEDRRELNMLFQFELMELDYGPKGKWETIPWQLSEIKRIFNDWECGLQDKGWNSLFLNNHDQPRVVSRFGDDGVYRVQSAKMLGTLLLTLQGTPFIYQGEEIGMTNVRYPDIDSYRDVETLNMYREELAAGKSRAEVMEAVYLKGRDNARTPMQWDDSPNAGFSQVSPWIEVNPNYRLINVQQAEADGDSILNYYRELIRMRKKYPVAVYGSYQELLPRDEQIFSYLRSLEHDRLLVILNFSARPAYFALPGRIGYSSADLLIANYPLVSGQALSFFQLQPYEARVYLLR